MESNNDGEHTLHGLVSDLSEICSLMSDLCSQLQGGGLVQARDIETSIAAAVPKLRHAVSALAAATLKEKHGELGSVTAPSQSPLLM